MADKHEISLVVADVDGTLVDEHKVLTARAQTAVLKLYEAGIRFAVTSGRPPAGMAMLIDPLKIDTPIAGFNGLPGDTSSQTWSSRNRRRASSATCRWP